MVVKVTDVGTFCDRLGWLRNVATEPHWAVNSGIPYGWIDPSEAEYGVLET